MNLLLNAAVLLEDVETAAILYKRLEGAEEWYAFGGTGPDLLAIASPIG